MENLEKEEVKKQFLKLPIYATGENLDVELKSVLGEMKSEFQNIEFVDTKNFGKCLVIDNVIQTAETDHEAYDEKMLSMMKEKDKNILILGGGDGYIAQMAIQKNPKINVDVAELDKAVVDGCVKYLDQNVFENKNVQLLIGDALKYMKETEVIYDGIVCDLTDAPVGAKEQEEFINFFEEVIDLSNKRLKKDGWISVQAGASTVLAPAIDAVSIIKSILEKHSLITRREDMVIPSYGESCAFLFAQKG